MLAETLVILSLILGGVAVDVANRAPTLMFFDLFFFLLLVRRLVWFEWPCFRDRSVFCLVTICVIFQILGSLVNPVDLFKGILTIKALVFGFLLYGMLLRKPIAEWCVPVWLGGAGIVTLFSFYEAVKDGMNDASAMKDAVVTPMGPNNYLACYLLMLLPVGVALFYGSSGIRKKLFYGGCLLAGCAGFIATLSRGAFAALLVAVGCSISLMYKSGLRIKHFLISLILLLMVLAIFSQQITLFYDFFGDKLAVGDVARMELWKKAIQAFEQNPILGVGPGQFLNYTQESGADGSRLGAHNTYLQILAEGGILGSIPIFTLMIVLLRRVYVIAKTSLDPVQIAIWIGLFAAMIHNTVDTLFWTQHFQVLFWLLSAISFTKFSPGAERAKALIRGSRAVPSDVLYGGAEA